MPTLAFPVDALIQRLSGAAELKFVGLAPDLSAALDTAPRLAPAVFVLTETRGGPLKYSGPPVQQDRTTALKLIVWVRNHGDAAAVRRELDTVLAAIDARLAGWSPGNAFAEPHLVASRDEFAHAQYLVNQCVYESSWNFSANPQ